MLTKAFVKVKAKIHHSNDVWRCSFKWVHAFHRASNNLPSLAGTLKTSARSGHHTWLTPALRPYLSICDLLVLTTMKKPGQQQPEPHAAAQCDPGHPAFVSWDRDGEHRFELVHLKRWRTQYRLSKANMKSSFRQAHGVTAAGVHVHDTGWS